MIMENQIEQNMRIEVETTDGQESRISNWRGALNENSLA